MAGAGIETGDKRAVNAELNLVPFIDLLMVTCAFLLITAVWVSSSSIDVNANVPNDPSGVVDPRPEDKTLHVYVEAETFRLVWKQGSTALSEVSVPREKVAPGQMTRFPELARRIVAEWRQHGTHKSPSDAGLDQAVLHTDEKTPYREMAAVMDAIHATKREMATPSGVASVPAMNLTFSVR
jgi:biopolymer transport protein ExbD